MVNINKKSLSLLLIVMIFFLLIGLRFIFPRTDGPIVYEFGFTHLESLWAINARNYALFGDFITDKFNPIFVMPLYTFIVTLSFIVFGVGTWQNRLPTMALSSISLILFYKGIKQSNSKNTALFAAIILGLNFYHFAFSRAATADGMMLSFMIASFYFWQKGFDKPFYFFFAGVSAILAALTKPYSVFMVLIPITATIYVVYNKKKSLSKAIKPTMLMILGAIIAALIIILPFLYFFPEAISYTYNKYISIRVERSILPFLFQIGIYGFKLSFFKKTFILATLGFIYFIYLIRQLLQKKYIGKNDSFFFFLTIFGTAFVFLADIQSHRFIFLLPTFSFFSSRLIIRLYSFKKFRIAKIAGLKHKWVIILAIFYYIQQVLENLFYFLLRKKYLILPDFQAFINLISSVRTISHSVFITYQNIIILSTLLSIGITIFFALIFAYLIKRMKDKVISTFPVYCMLLLIMLIYFSMNIIQIGNLFINREYTIYKDSRQLGQILPPTTIQGPIAVSYLLENKHKALYFSLEHLRYPVIIGNYENRLKRKDIRYFMGIPGSLLVKEFLDAWPSSKEIATFKLQNETIALYDKFPKN